MAFVDTPNLALPGSAVQGDGAGTWHTQWNQICANVEARLTKSGAGTPVGVVAGEFVGQWYYRTDVPQRWFCTLAGIAGVATWSSSITVDVTGTFRSSGLTFLDYHTQISGGNLTLQTGVKQIIPNGEAWLRRSGGTPDDMNVHAHAARHRPGSTNGAWAAAADFMGFSIQQIRHSATLLGTGTAPVTAILSQTFGAAGVAKCSVNFSTVGRPTTSRGLIWYRCQYHNLLNNSTLWEISVYRATAAGTVGVVGTDVGPIFVSANLGFDGGGPDHIYSGLSYVEGLAAGQTHEFAMHARDAGAADALIDNVQLIYIDLGTE